ncbi:MAG TPA: GAF domain-containing protein [Phycisphaerales bacterium]|nr:GAF domain-containing protein [Phycisphaerales bacterium]
MTVAIRRVALTPQCYRTVLQHVAAGDVPSLVIQLQNELVARHNHPPDIRIEWWSLDQHDAVLRLAESAGWPWPVRHRVCPIPGVTLSGGKSMAGTSIRTGLVWANDTEHDQRFHDFADAIDQACGKSRSIACYPTYAETHARGVLAIASSRACEFTRADVELLIAFADAVGAALARRPAA